MHEGSSLSWRQVDDAAKFDRFVLHLGRGLGPRKLDPAGSFLLGLQDTLDKIDDTTEPTFRLFAFIVWESAQRVGRIGPATMRHMVQTGEIEPVRTQHIWTDYSDDDDDMDDYYEQPVRTLADLRAFVIELLHCYAQNDWDEANDSIHGYVGVMDRCDKPTWASFAEGLDAARFRD